MHHAAARDAEIDIGARKALCRLRSDVEQNHVEPSGCGGEESPLPVLLLRLWGTDPVLLTPLPQSIRIASVLPGLAAATLDEVPSSGTLASHVEHMACVVTLGAARDGLGFGDLALCHGRTPFVMARQ